MNQPTASIQLLTGVLLFYGVRECFAFAKSLKANSTSQNLSAAYVCPNAEKRKENKARKHNNVYSA